MGGEEAPQSERACRDHRSGSGSLEPSMTGAVEGSLSSRSDIIALLLQGQEGIEGLMTVLPRGSFACNVYKDRWSPETLGQPHVRHRKLKLTRHQRIWTSDARWPEEYVQSLGFPLCFPLLLLFLFLLPPTPTLVPPSFLFSSFSFPSPHPPFIPYHWRAIQVK